MSQTQEHSKKRQRQDDGWSLFMIWNGNAGWFTSAIGITNKSVEQGACELRKKDKRYQAGRVVFEITQLANRNHAEHMHAAVRNQLVREWVNEIQVIIPPERTYVERKVAQLIGLAKLDIYRHSRPLIVRYCPKLNIDNAWIADLPAHVIVVPLGTPIEPLPLSIEKKIRKPRQTENSEHQPEQKATQLENAKGNECPPPEQKSMLTTHNKDSPDVKA